MAEVLPTENKISSPFISSPFILMITTYSEKYNPRKIYVEF